MRGVSSLKLPVNMERAALMLAEGWTQVKAANEVGVSAQTMNRWVKQPEFSDRVAELRSNSSKQADEILEMSIVEAAQTVRNIATGSTGVEDTKELNPMLRAALYILERSAKRAVKGTSGPGGPLKRPSLTDREYTMDDDEADELLGRMNDGE